MVLFLFKLENCLHWRTLYIYIRFKEHLRLTVESSQHNPDEATQLVVFVLHSLKNKRETHMMESSDDDDEDESSQFQGLRFPLTHLAALKQLLHLERVAVLQLQQDADKLGLPLGLWTEGLLRNIKSTNALRRTFRAALHFQLIPLCVCVCVCVCVCQGQQPVTL
ncbi:ribosomal oxygenase 2-like [Myxocyprinus asiaticus]|uniref:ribosomal oxygenase 2-like n=1 Tax=Myxocyprinus asiaticus TaxID=70543 RepID=UPI002222A298|nr:ribosomal oxygenase 2-like [Myxocyprinus asiaticus]